MKIFNSTRSYKSEPYSARKDKNGLAEAEEISFTINGQTYKGLLLMNNLVNI
jgi:hypothetical protein